MIRSKDLTDKLIADLHFHNYLNVNAGDDFFTDRNRGIDQTKYMLSDMGLADKIDAETDFYHCGRVATQNKLDHIYEYIDDVFIDYFFRTYKFKDIIFPKGTCYRRVTPNGIKECLKEDVLLNLNDLYDRCTFCHNMSMLFSNNRLSKYYPNHRFSFLYMIEKIYGVGCLAYILSTDTDIMHNAEWENYLAGLYSPKEVVKSKFRSWEIIKYIKHLRDTRLGFFPEGLTTFFYSNLSEFNRGYLRIKDEHFFGEYSIEDLFYIYALLIDKFFLDEDTFLICLCHLSANTSDTNHILKAFMDFENLVTDYKIIEPFIKSKDLYLRFTNIEKSKAVSYESKNDAIVNLKFFDQNPVEMVYYNNTLPLPYLYDSLKN